MDAKQANQTFDLVGYVSKLVTLHGNSRYFIGACPICGGKDRFNIKRTETGDVWICRKCRPNKYHTVIDFLMEYHQESFVEALKRIGGNIEPLRQENNNRKSLLPGTPTQVFPPSEWQAGAWALVEAAAGRLIGDDFDGLFAWHYLIERGLNRGSIFRNWLGYTLIYKRPAIVIPWFDDGYVITAVKYRFIDNLAKNDKGKRFSMMAGSLPYLFGVQHILASDDILLFVEGELNAISLLQFMPHGISIVSTGAETNGNPTLLKSLVRHYHRVVIWMDDPQKGCAMGKRMNRPDAQILKSPPIDGVKYDANQMLMEGFLDNFIVRQLSTVCDGVSSSGDIEKV